MPDSGLLGGHRLIDNSTPDAKLQTISTAGKVANTATTATSGATANAIIARDASGRAQVADPVASSDIANKVYVDAAVAGARDPKESCRVATTGNTTQSGLQTIDGVVLVAGDRVLMKDQTTAAQNGIWVASAGVWTRSTDADAGTEVSAGMFTWVTEGTVNADSGWLLTTNDPIVVGTTALTFIQVSGLGQIVDGNALTKTGNTLNVNVDNISIEIVADALQVKALGITAAMLAGSIPDTKLSTISTAGKVANTATTGTAANTASTLVLRDAAGRAAFVDPAAAQDAATKNYVDTKFIVNETPTGTIDGTNAAFTLANAPAAGTLELFLQGIKLLQGTHYNLAGSTITYVSPFQPISGEWHRANYTK